MQISVPYINILNAYLTVVVAFFCLPGIKPGKIPGSGKEHHRPGGGRRCSWHCLVYVRGFTQEVSPVQLCGHDLRLVVLGTVVSVKKLSDKFLVLVNRRVLAAGTLVFLIEALWVNVARPLHYQTPRLLDYLAFAVFLLSFGYVAVQIAFANERRLLSIENELEVARQLQFSILPTTIPDVRNLRIAATYRPMTAVAGDFYEFIPVDPKRVGSWWLMSRDTVCQPR